MKTLEKIGDMFYMAVVTILGLSTLFALIYSIYEHYN